MRLILLLFPFMLATNAMQSQVLVDSVDINELDIQYILVEIGSPGFANNFRIYVDYGQRSRINQFERIVSDQNRSTIRFNSPADGLNYLYRRGWEVKDVYAQHEEDGTFLMVRREE